MLGNFTKLDYVLPTFTIGDYHALMRSWRNLKGFESNQVAQFRLKVLKHYSIHGWKSACDAFEIPKSTLFDWRRVFEASGRKLNSLVPKSTRPHRTRIMVTDVRLIELIKSIRFEYGRVSKYKLKVFVDEYASELGIPGYGLDKIARIIRRNRFFFDRQFKRKYRIRPLSPRLKRAPKQTIPGYVEMDSVTVYFLSKVRYFITAIDVASKFAWCKMTTSLSSGQAKKAAEEFIGQYQYQVREIQTDNGHEFMGEFDQYLVSSNIPHNLIYPRSPKVNGVVERFNKTIQDEFISRQGGDHLSSLETFTEKLNQYLIWYNTKRPHLSLNLMTPVQYLQTFKTT